MSTVKFICFSDTHGIAPPVVDEHGVVAWLHGGDFCNYGLDGPWIASEKKLLAWSKKRTIPVYLVRGNHDYGDAAASLIAQCGHDISGCIVEVAPHLFVVGVGYSGRSYGDTPKECDLAKVCDTIVQKARSTLSSDDACIVLSHYPAKIGDFLADSSPANNAAYDCVRTTIEELSPIVVIQGHVHHLFGVKSKHEYSGRQSLILNPGPTGGILTINMTDRSAAFQDRLTAIN